MYIAVWSYVDSKLLYDSYSNNKALVWWWYYRDIATALSKIGLFNKPSNVFSERIFLKY